MRTILVVSGVWLLSLALVAYAGKGRDLMTDDFEKNEIIIQLLKVMPPKDVAVYAKMPLRPIINPHGERVKCRWLIKVGDIVFVMAESGYGICGRPLNAPPEEKKK